MEVAAFRVETGIHIISRYSIKRSGQSGKNKSVCSLIQPVESYPVKRSVQNAYYSLKLISGILPVQTILLHPCKNAGNLLIICKTNKNFRILFFVAFEKLSVYG